MPISLAETSIRSAPLPFDPTRLPPRSVPARRCGTPGSRGWPQARPAYAGVPPSTPSGPPGPRHRAARGPDGLLTPIRPELANAVPTGGTGSQFLHLAGRDLDPGAADLAQQVRDFVQQLDAILDIRAQQLLA